MLTTAGQLLWASCGYCQIQCTGLEGMVCTTNYPHTCQITVQYEFIGQCSMFPCLTWKGKSVEQDAAELLDFCQWHELFFWIIWGCVPIAFTHGTKTDKHSDWINCFKNYSDVTAGKFLTLLVSRFKSWLGKNKCSSQCHNSSTLFQLTIAIQFLRTEWMKNCLSHLAQLYTEHFNGVGKNTSIPRNHFSPK